MKNMVRIVGIVGVVALFTVACGATDGTQTDGKEETAQSSEAVTTSGSYCETKILDGIYLMTGRCINFATCGAAEDTAQCQFHGYAAPDVGGCSPQILASNYHPCSF